MMSFNYLSFYSYIGQGSYAQVYKVEKIDTSEEFVVKVFDKDNLLKQNSGKDNLIQEIQIMR